ncbi:MAG: hypothetical protein HYX25_09905 [Candidatus Solibacter usitatus]|nr:hypothetical protein [Candidatus Solibacter usitatus]
MERVYHSRVGLLRQSAGVLLLCSTLQLVSAADVPPGLMDRALNRLYNTDFPGAFLLLDEYVAAKPNDPLGYALRSSGYLFAELDRLGVLEGEFFVDDKRIAEKKGLKPDPAVRVKILKAIQDAQSRAGQQIAAQPDDQNALFSMAATNGVMLDYTALVEKKQISSLSSARTANDYAQRLVKLNPKFYDAYLTTGLTEYLVASLPFYVKWFVHFDDVKGSKTQAIENLRLVATSGRYLKPFAKILLAIVASREKQPEEARRLLAELAVEFPENQLIHKELNKFTVKLEGPKSRRP